MFTLEQIKEAHSKVKSGADFPAYIQDMKKLGVTAYTHRVADGQTIYSGANSYSLAGPTKWDARPIAPTANADKLKTDLAAHQEGRTSYPHFCEDAANAGVEKWIVDLHAMTCTYYDTAGGEMLREDVPG